VSKAGATLVEKPQYIASHRPYGIKSGACLKTGDSTLLTGVSALLNGVSILLEWGAIRIGRSDTADRPAILRRAAIALPVHFSTKARPEIITQHNQALKEKKRSDIPPLVRLLLPMAEACCRAVRWAEGHGSRLQVGCVRHGCKGNSLKASTKILEKNSSIGLNYESEKQKAICYCLCMILPAYLLCFRLNST